ncbi:XRE family transcriptional regulator [Staphylococcus sp. IVB6181]|uniref:helix-turn-helix domain-containing protein n=1 Tax=Staphylococcus sp. IVB6181 TaxID=2929481 RepID=UPI0021D1EF8A|nr:XRE family transcriptional regulator [Staphylococcus sp. IVB6181]UXV34530.1 XRE family transcriptional regulator [Staphylococcus sp. IVB6181]
MDKKELALFIGNKIRYYRTKMNLTQDQLGEKLNTKKATISNYETGYRTPKQDDLFEIAHILNVSIDDLFPKRHSKKNDITTVYNQLTPPRQHNVLDFANKQLEEQNNEVSENDRNIITIKRMHAAAAGVVGEELFDDLIEEDVEFYEDEVPKGADFCILVNGDSMEPMIKEGTYAFIKRETNIKDGTIALVVLDGTSFIKRVDIHPEYLKLISLNPKYEDITVSSFNDLKVVGKIVL